MGLIKFTIELSPYWTKQLFHWDRDKAFCCSVVCCW